MDVSNTLTHSKFMVLLNTFIDSFFLFVSISVMLIQSEDVVHFRRMIHSHFVELFRSLIRSMSMELSQKLTNFLIPVAQYNVRAGVLRLDKVSAVAA